MVAVVTDHDDKEVAVEVDQMKYQTLGDFDVGYYSAKIPQPECGMRNNIIAPRKSYSWFDMYFGKGDALYLYIRSLCILVWA